MNSPSARLKLALTRSAWGRALLHIGCLCRGGQWRFHGRGVGRALGRHANDH